jgi:glycosyltransferase involved in cell wall biosynthesis
LIDALFQVHMNATLPRISVITPSFQQAAYLERTIVSVLSQNYPNLEYIIIDGGSTDGSVEIIRKYAPRLAHWKSGPDAGQADAINQGFNLATGSLLLWINSDDLLLPGALEMAAGYHQRHPDAILLADVINFIDGQDWGYRLHPHDVTTDNLLALWNARGFWHQPGTFVPRKLLENAPLLDPRHHFHFDREWLCRLLARGAPVIYTHTVASAFRLHPASKTSREAPGTVAEMTEICGRLAEFLSPAERAFVPAGLELMQANYFVSPKYPLFWNRTKALHHLLKAWRLSWKTPGCDYFRRVALKLITPRWFTSFIAQRISAKNEVCPLPPGYA